MIDEGGKTIGEVTENIEKLFSSGLDFGSESVIGEIYSIQLF